MANTIRDFSATASINTIIAGLDIDEGCSPANINDAIRELMADLKDVSTGAVALESPAFDSASLTGDLTFGTNDAAVFGSSTNLRIYNDGSNSIIEEGSGTGDLFLRGTNNVYVQVSADGSTWENAVLCDADGAVTLRWNNANRLTTTGTGVSVTGTVAATAFTGDGSGLTGLGGGFPSGTKMLFGQTAAPTGWTKITTDDDAALRIVSGTVGSGGSSGLSTALATPTVTGTIAGSTGSHTLSISEMPSHNHSITTIGSNQNVPTYILTGRNPDSSTASKYTNSTGGGGSHSHSLSATFSGGTAAINVKYVDVIMASKD